MPLPPCAGLSEAQEVAALDLFDALGVSLCSHRAINAGEIFTDLLRPRFGAR